MADAIKEGRQLPLMPYSWARRRFRAAAPPASAEELAGSAGGLEVTVSVRQRANWPPLTPPAPPAPRERPPGDCSLPDLPCSITALARTPCVHAGPSGSPLPIGLAATYTLLSAAWQRHIVPISLAARGGLDPRGPSRRTCSASRCIMLYAVCALDRRSSHGQWCAAPPAWATIG